ncbi:hypothetical protein HpCOL21_11380 [Helicobacter pylori]
MLFSKDTDFVPVLEAAGEKGFEVFIAKIKESPISVPLDLKKSCDVRVQCCRNGSQVAQKSAHPQEKELFHQ